MPYQRQFALCWFALLVSLLGSVVWGAPSELLPLDSPPDPRGQLMQQQLIWTTPGVSLSSSFVAFRKRFALSAVPTQANLSLFADVRYMLWINGQYVQRGPARFNPQGPEYDVSEVKRLLKPGNNEIAVVVMATQSNGKMMKHAPGLTVRLEGSDPVNPLVVTDETWKWSDQTRYRRAHIDWGNELDVIDSTLEDGDWTQVDYQDDAWKSATKSDGTQWGPLSARRIPMMKDTEVPFKWIGRELPITLNAGESVKFDQDRMVQAYTVLDCEAEQGTEFELSYAKISYKAKAGAQHYVSSDTHGFKEGAIQVKTGKLTIHSLKLVESIYPFECVGSFKCNDALLNKLWKVCARSLQVMSEDAYIDCCDRERTEWMDCDPPAFDLTRTAMVGPSEGSGPVYADPRLLEEMLRRTALTLQPQGWVKAHTCSDRFDIHAKMEDRACDWIEGARRYYESSGKLEPIREIWPAVVAQLKYFLDRRSARGLVIAREWVIWGNPVGYQTCEGAGLNAFIYKALVDAAYLGKLLGKTVEAEQFDQAAKDLGKAFNTVLWNQEAGTYYSGWYTDPSELPPGVKNRKLSLPVQDHLIAPNIHAAIFALDQGIVPPDRLDRVKQYVLTEPDPNARVMFYYFYWKQLYEANQAKFDTLILQSMRRRWKGMADWPWQTTWEDFSGGSKAHCYGMFPGYFLSSYILGVRLDGPVMNKHLLINPRLGDLTSAEGTVLTEFGLVPTSWKRSTDHLDFTFTVPAGISASLQLPSYGGKAKLEMENVTVHSSGTDSSFIISEVKPGTHSGTLTYPADAAPLVSPSGG